MNELTGAVRGEKVVGYFDTLFKEKTTLVGALNLSREKMIAKQKQNAQYDAQNRESGVEAKLILFFFTL